MIELRIPDKYALTIEEAAAYFHIGEKRLRMLVQKNPNEKWVLWKGNHVMIKRRLFEEMLDAANVI